jgi:predicted methyltransferase
MVCNVVHSFRAGVYSMGCASLECVSSLADRVGSFAQSCLQRAGEQSPLDESSNSLWEELKNKAFVCVDSSLSAIRGVGQVFSRVITFVCNELEEGYLYLFDRDHHRGNARQAIERNGSDLEHCSRLSKNNKEIVLAAVRQKGFALRYASEALRADRDVVFAAVRQNGRALGFASTALRGDEDVVRAAVTNTPSSIECASEELRRDPEMILAVLPGYNSVLAFERNQPNPLTANKQFMMRAVAIRGLALEYASEELKEDKDVVLAAVTQKGCALEHASAELQNDEEIVRAAVAKQGFGFDYASERLQTDPGCIAAREAGALQNQAAILQWRLRHAEG